MKQTTRFLFLTAVLAILPMNAIAQSAPLVPMPTLTNNNGWSFPTTTVFHSVPPGGPWGGPASYQAANWSEQEVTSLNGTGEYDALLWTYKKVVAGNCKGKKWEIVAGGGVEPKNREYDGVTADDFVAHEEALAFATATNALASIAKLRPGVSEQQVINHLFRAGGPLCEQDADAAPCVPQAPNEHDGTTKPVWFADGAQGGYHFRYYVRKSKGPCVTQTSSNSSSSTGTGEGGYGGSGSGGHGGGVNGEGANGEGAGTPNDDTEGSA